MPILNSMFPTQENVFFMLIFAGAVMIMEGLYRRLFKTAVFVAIFLTLFILSGMYSKSPSVIMAFRMTLMFVPCLVLASVLITEYNSSEILAALQKLKLHKIFVVGITVTLRYIPTFAREFKVIRSSMETRGVGLSFLHPIRTFEYLIVPQLFRCLSLSGELTAAGLTKGISAPGRRTNYFEQIMGPMDYAAFVIFFVGFGIVAGGVV